jgi:hypothetical protein
VSVRRLAGIVLAAALLAGCGAEERRGGTTSTGTSTPADLAVPIVDANRARDALVRTVLGKPTDRDPLEALVARYPSLRFGSERTTADARGVSTWWTPLDQYEAEAPDNPTLFVVAVLDENGLCAVGAATGTGLFREGLTAADDGGACTAEAARDRLGIAAP